MKFKPFAIVFLISLALLLAFFWIRAGYIELFSLSGLRLTSLVYGITYYILTIVMLRKFREKLSPGWIVTAIVLGTVILEFPIWFTTFNPVAWPETCVRLLAIGGGYLCWRIPNRIVKVALSGLFLAFCLWISYPGYELWVNKVNYGTWTGRQDKTTYVGGVRMQTPEGETVRLEKFRGRYLVLDFISRSCGVCIRKLPLVQELHDAYADDPRVVVYTVFCRITKRSETAQMCSDMLAKKNYTLPVLSIPMDDPDLTGLFRVETFPDVQVVDPEGKVVFRGDIEDVDGFLSDALSK